MSTPLFFCMRIPEFPAQALVRLRPALAKTAVAVLQGEPPQEKTCAATLQARRLGVRHGMTRAELESFPHVTALRRSGAEEQHAALTLLEMAAEFTPRTQELPRTSALTLALDMTGATRLLGPPHVIGQKLFRSARELGFFARVASSRNLQTAACLIRAPGDTLIVVSPGEERARLKDLPLTAFGLTGEQLDTFQAWGVRSAGDLAALLPADLVARLGQEGHRLHRLACGEEEHLLLPAETAFTLEEHLAFDAPVDNLESLLFALAPMLDQLVQRARNRALQLASVTVRLHLERPVDSTDRDRNRESETEPDDPTHERTLKPALPLDDRVLLLKLLQLDLQAHPSPAAIVAITLHAEPGPRPGVQAGLFSPQSPEPMRLEVTLARIAALVGEERVGRAILNDTHTPEGFRVERFAVAETRTQTNTAMKRQKQSPLLTPATHRTGVALRRLRPAPLVQVTLEAGRLKSLFLHASGVDQSHYVVSRAFGPWRCSGHWWSGDVWAREEWDVDAQAADGSRLLALLTNDRLRLHWQLDALYD